MGTSIRTLDGDETSFSGCHRCYPGYWRDKIRWLIIGVRSSVKSWEKRDLFFSTTSPGSFFGFQFFVKCDRSEHLWFFPKSPTVD